MRDRIEPPLSAMRYSGTVQRGGQRARSLGFPTINIPLSDPAVSGSYAGTVVCEGRVYEAVLYADQGRGVLEAHLLDVAEDLYGKSVTMSLLEKLRKVEQFSNDALLIEAIQKDAAAARAYFKEHPVV